MESCAFAQVISPSTPVSLKVQRSPKVGWNFNKQITLNSYACPKQHRKYSLFSTSLISNSSSSFSNKGNLLLSSYSLNIANESTARAFSSASVPGSSENEGAKQTGLARTLQLAAMFGIWYSLNIYFNIYNKQVLKVFPFPATLTAVQFGCGTLMILLMWGSNLYPTPKLKRSMVVPILTLAIVHTMGNFLTNISLGKVAVSFTHTIKAMEPFFTVLFSFLFMSQRPTIWVVSSLVPIVGGVTLASLTEASFNWVGFSSAMASNFTNQSRNVLSKKFMIRKKDALDNINLFSIITIISFILLVPIAILIEGFKFTPSFLQRYTASQGLNLKHLCLKALLTGVCFHSYQQVSYMILEMVSAVTHAVGNCVKRVVLIVSSVIFFQTPLSPINSLGTGLALAGVFLYSRAKQMKAEDAQNAT